MVAARKSGGSYCQPVEDRFTHEVVYEVYKEWELIDKCESHQEAVQALHSA